MLLEAIVSRADLDRLLAQFLPAEIAVEESATLTLEPPFEVAIVPDEGIRATCKARVRWPVVGIHVPIDIRSLAFLVEVAVRDGAHGAVLELRVAVEKVDFALLPAAIDDRIRTRINEALVKNHVAWSWDFADTLSQVVTLPPAVASSGALALEVRQGVVRMNDGAVGFAVSFDTAVRARIAASEGAPSRPPNADRPSGDAPHGDRASDASPLPFATAGALAGLALVAAFGAGRFSKR